MESYAIIGTGAIGGYCAVKLKQAGFDVHCLLGTDYEYVKQNGLTILERGETITVPVNIYKDVQDMPVCDVILVALKATANSILKEMLPKLMYANSVVVLLQNGIGMEAEIADYIAADKIVGGVCHLKVTKHSPGVITHYGFNEISLAQFYLDDYQSGLTKQVEQLVQNFTKAGFNSFAMPHLPTIRWKKLVSNIALSGLSVVLDASNNELVNNEASFSLICAITREVIAAAQQCGADIPDDFYNIRLQVLEKFKTMSKNYSSMKDDFNVKKPLELHTIYENAINIAKRQNAAMPLTEMLYQQLLYLNTKNLSSTL